MPVTYIWYSFEELLPHDKEWILVADDRFSEPKKALFRKGAVNDLYYNDGKFFHHEAPWEHVYAWTSMPIMPSPDIAEKGFDG